MAESIATFVLDSFAVMAHFQAEFGGEKVLALLEQAGRDEVLLTMSLINVGESEREYFSFLAWLDSAMY